MYGTAWKEERTSNLVHSAIAAGFRAVDTANQRRHYDEAAVGDAIASLLESGPLTRADLFLQTKFTYARGQDHRIPYDPSADFGSQVHQSFESSLEHLRTEYVDSYVLHGPSSSYGLTEVDWTVWRAMESIHARGKAHVLGVSNVSLEQLVSLYERVSTKPAFVQNRCFANTGWDRAVRAYCRDNGILYQGFSLLTANARFLSLPPVSRASQRTGKSAAQVVFRFALQVGMIPLTGTSSRSHMEDDLACLDFALEPSEVRAIEEIAG
jgi:diketogulonate reductase-like aldo/keto reductase